MSSINWGDLRKAADDGGFEALPPNEYDVYVAKAEAARTSSDKDMVKVQFKVETGPNAGKTVFNQFVISPDNANALGFFFRHMAALGLNDAFFASNPSIEQLAASLENRRCRIRVSIRKWQEQERNNVDAILPPSSGSAAPATPGSGAPGAVPNAGPGGVPGGIGHFAPAGGGNPSPAPPAGMAAPSSYYQPVGAGVPGAPLTVGAPNVDGGTAPETPF